MLTRRQVRGVFLWLGIACGGVGVLLFVMSFFGQLVYTGPLREVSVGRGGVYLVWYRTAQTVRAPAVAVVPGPVTAPATTTSPAAPPVTVYAGPSGSGNPTADELARLREQARIISTETARLNATTQALMAQRLTLTTARVPRVPRPRAFEFSAAPTDRGWHWMPRFVSPDELNNSPGRLALPFWVLLAVGMWCVYLKLPRDVPAGTCPGCRFDLRGVPALEGHPGLARCPECGKVSEAAAPTVAGATSPAAVG